ncbi:MAG TPA: 3-hydroxyacyl-ACP dehydratase FabZ [Fimbriimonadaceae bacterium]|nr:3-hydroxyacyl-[acyl-carrier-protein] dehydratase FabZ [Armatimonadota bacterium]HCM74514.1 3-hydroxyacyl-[acyl-carrier-protein] dehydratase FabZ [Armatimonadota bacterium]HRD31741.1 3-hydroxyacyl-ACP dehydratase FabZ [Fimbriimonadaceae bacterium]HRE93058.1 3-hydroxyacyl-ACP dehydratase FabZ [Fimbriimonadaceae bacterium]HRI75025.1 3-hydroxyacyl-ACP dehydratase FabZ [Fimbriimonadaceae bacterium]
MACALDINAIMKVLPHRYPILLVDRILEVEPGMRCVGIKNVTINEGFFQGHYPGQPIMPGVLIVESLAQCGAVILLSQDSYRGMVPVIGAIDNVKFKRQVVPGDQLRLEIELLWIKSSIGRIKGVATVDGQLAAQMEMTFKLIATGGNENGG